MDDVHACAHTEHGELGEGLPLVNALTPPKESSIRLGRVEVGVLADYLEASLAAPDARQGEGGGETDVVRADYWPDYLLGRVIDEIENSDAFDYSSVIKSNTLARLRHLQQQLPRSPDALQGEGDEPAEGYGMTAREYYGQLADRGGYLAALDAAIQEIERLRRLRAPQGEGAEG